MMIPEVERSLERALELTTRFGVVVDGGAHIGNWTSVFAQRFQQVLSFEPTPATFAVLQSKVIANNLTNVILFNAALGNEKCQVEMITDGKHNSSRSRFARKVSPFDGGEVQSVPMVRLDEVVELQGLDLLKLDLEGAEALALMGAREVIKKYRPVVVIEISRKFPHRFGLTNNAAHRVLRKLGWRLVSQCHRDYFYVPSERSHEFGK